MTGWEGAAAGREKARTAPLGVLGAMTMTPGVGIFLIGALTSL
jgi:hypothetical protein